MTEQCENCGTEYDLETNDHGLTMCVDCWVMREKDGSV